METLKRLLSPEYLVVSEPGPVGALWPLYVALGLLFTAGLALAVWALAVRHSGDRAGGERQAAGRGWAWFELWVNLVGLGTVAGRFLNWPGWSARIWPYTLVILAASGWLAYRARRRTLPGWALNQLQILTFTLPSRHSSSPTSNPQPSAFQRSDALGLALHLAGMALVLASRYGWPVWTAVPVLALVLAPQWPLFARRQPPRLAALTPLLAAYGVTLLWLLYQAMGITVIAWQGQAFPNPLVSLFYVDGVVLAAVAYSLLCQTHTTLVALGRPSGLGRWAVVGLLAVTLSWSGLVYFGKRTHGATATDPYAYAQMGADLADNGTFLHRFPLFQQVIPLHIAWAPLQPVGYHIPRNDLGDCPSVWATGASVLLAAGYRLLGETGLYVTTPIVGLLALAATWALIQETLHGQRRVVRYATGAVAVALLASSPENVDRLLVPMADAPATLFTVLALLLLLVLTRYLHIGSIAAGSKSTADTRPATIRLLMAAGLGGACFAWAYWARHTQIVLALPALVAVAVGTLRSQDLAVRLSLPSRKIKVPVAKRRATGDPVTTRRWRAAVYSLVIFFSVALAAALPDIVYRWRVFGGLFRTETTELPLMGIQHIGPVAWQMLRDALVAGEWGYLFPFALYGGYRLARSRGRSALVLTTAFAAVLLANLSYQSLRLRDLMSLFPLLDLAVAYGMVSLVRQARSAIPQGADRLGPALLAATAVAWVVVSLGMARWAMIDNLWKPGWASFGYMRAEHRAAFDRLAEITPPNAVIGASLNSGAVMMYTGRDAIRPYDSWTAEEWQIFLDAMRAAGRPVYLLDDGGLMAEFIDREHAGRRLTPIEPLLLPLYFTQDRETGWLYRLEWDW